MRLMEEKILTEGKVLPGQILKVGSFLNQQIDTALLAQIGQEIARLYDGAGVSKVLTIESSGIAIAAAAGMAMGVPVVFAKKHKSSNVDGEVYTASVHSYTLMGLSELVAKAGATLTGAAIAIEKGFQGGGDALRAQGVRVESLAIIDAMDDNRITFRPQ